MSSGLICQAFRQKDMDDKRSELITLNDMSKIFENYHSRQRV